MKNYFFILFAAGAIQSVVFGGRQTIPLSIEGINLASTVNYLEISFAFAVGQLISGAVTPLGGAISDKYGSGKTLLLGIIITTIGCFLIPYLLDKRAPFIGVFIIVLFDELPFSS